MVRMRVSCSSNCCAAARETSFEVCREPGGELLVTGEPRCNGGEAARPSRLVGIIALVGEDGSGGSGIEGGGVGSPAVPFALRP